MGVFSLQKLFWSLQSYTWDEYQSATKYAEEINAITTVISNLVQLPQPVLLDLGCATGNFAIAFSHNRFQVTGIDYEKEMLKRARFKANQSNCKNITFIESDLNKELPFSDTSFDIVFASHIVQGIKVPAEFFSEVRRVVSRNGYFIIIIKKRVNKHKFKFTPALSKSANAVNVVKYLLFRNQNNRFINLENLEMKVEQCGFTIHCQFETERNRVLLFRSC